MQQRRGLAAPAIRTRGALWVIPPSSAMNGISRAEAQTALTAALWSAGDGEITDERVQTTHRALCTVLGSDQVRLLCATPGHARIITPDAHVLYYQPGGTIVPLEGDGVISCPLRPDDILMLRDQS